MLTLLNAKQCLYPHFLPRVPSSLLTYQRPPHYIDIMTTPFGEGVFRPDGASRYANKRSFQVYVDDVGPPNGAQIPTTLQWEQPLTTLRDVTNTNNGAASSRRGRGRPRKTSPANSRPMPPPPRPQGSDPPRSDTAARPQRRRGRPPGRRQRLPQDIQPKSDPTYLNSV